MNIFFLDSNIEKNAQYHVDKHVVKMRLELAQLACTAHHILWSNINIPYKKTHHNHPAAIWTRKSLANYNYVIDLGLALCVELRHRFNTPHQKTEEVLKFLKANPINVEIKEFTLPAVTTNDFKKSFAQYPADDFFNYAVDNYRKYYNEDKQHLFKWTNRTQPDWIILK